MLKNAINIGGRREVLWDDCLIDLSATDAEKVLHHPAREEKVFVYDMPWEGDGCDYQNFFLDRDGTYRMYYLGWATPNPKTGSKAPDIKVCYAESKDGINWIRPSLGICEFEGSRDNNIILNSADNNFDNFMVMRDPNMPEGSPELYKGICELTGGTLGCFISADAIHFNKGWMLTDRGCFDSLNTLLWDEKTKLYYVFLRGFHSEEGDTKYVGTRDIRVMTSPDFRTWSEPRLLEFTADPETGEKAPDFALYTNCVSKYYRAPHMFVGFPTRYVERAEWTPNFDRLCGKEIRRERMKGEKRFGLAITDCMFMSSRDGYLWDRPSEAYMRPEAEEPYNWLYGDCYPTLGMLETKRGNTDPVISMFVHAKHWTWQPTELWRYSIRVDGFISRHAPYKLRKLTTVPFIFDGNAMRMNFETSAAGSISIKLTGENGAISESGELFGNSIDRIIDFTGTPLSELAGNPVVMEIQMSDADIYSFMFCEAENE